MTEPRWRRYLRFWRADAVGDVNDELGFHFSQRVAEFEAAGLSHEDAIAAARARFGDVDAVREDLVRIDARVARRSGMWQKLDAARLDLRYVLRTLRRRPTVAATITLTLAIAVGANGAIFSLLDPLFFRAPTGVANPGSLYRVYANHPGMTRVGQNFVVGSRFEYRQFVALRDAMRDAGIVSAEGVWDSTDVTFDRNEITVGVNYVTANYLPMLGVRAERGRLFSAAEDDVASPADVAVVSDGFAKRFGGPSTVLGRRVRFRDHEYTVIGVTAAGFAGVDISETSIWVPFSTEHLPGPPGSPPWYLRGDSYIPLIVRLSPGVTKDAAMARATAAYTPTLSKGFGDVGASILLGPLSWARGPSTQSNGTLIVSRTAVVAALLLLIACANVANLFLAAGVARRREIGVRLALGVSRARLAADLALEAAVVAVIAGAASVIVASWAGGILRTQMLPRVAWTHAPVGSRVLVFTAATTLLAAVLAGALPAAAAWRAGAADALRSATPRSTRRHGRARSTLVAVQSALSVMLLVGASLFARTLQNARDAWLGYDKDRLVVSSVYFPDRRDHPETETLLPAARDRIAAAPGVEGVSLTMGGPMDSWYGGSLWRAGADSAHPIEHGAGNFIAVSPNYFAITSTRILEGRAFTAADVAGAPPVMIVGAAMARGVWPGERAIGQCLRPMKPSRPCYTVVGVAEDAHQFNIVSAPGEAVYYFPLDQRPVKSPPRTLVVRAAAGQAELVADRIRAVLRSTLPTSQARAVPMTRSLEREMRPWELGAQVFGALSLFALIVAVAGVYGVVAFEVRQRTREIGVRMALGAAGTRVMRMLVRQNTGVVALGVVIGVAGSLAAGRYVRSLLYGVAASDPVSLAVASALLILVAAAAAAVPAWRAQRINPAIVLRDE